MLTPRKHRKQIRHMCQVGAQPSACQIRVAYARYVARWIKGDVR